MRLLSNRDIVSLYRKGDIAFYYLDFTWTRLQGSNVNVVRLNPVLLRVDSSLQVS